MRISFWTALAALVAVTVRADTYQLQFHAEPGTTFEDPWDNHLVVGPGWIWQNVNEGFPGLTVYGNIYLPNETPMRVQCNIEANDATTGYVKESARLRFRAVPGNFVSLELDSEEFHSWKYNCWQINYAG